MEQNLIGNQVRIPVPTGTRISLTCNADSTLVQVVKVRFENRPIGVFSGTGSNVAMTSEFAQPVATLNNDIVIASFVFVENGVPLPAQNISPPIVDRGFVMVAAENNLNDNNYSYLIMFVPD